MKNEIKKIILSMDGKELKGLIVIRDNIVEHFGYGKIIKNELYRKYMDLIQELANQCQEEVAGLSNQDLVNKLFLLGKIEYNRKNLILKITDCFDIDNKHNKFIVEYENSKEEVKLSDCKNEEEYLNKYIKRLLEVCNTYGIKVTSVDDLKNGLLKKLKDLSLVEDKKETKTNRIVNDVIDNVIDDEDLNEDLHSVVNDSKIKNFVMNHKVLSGILAAGTILLITTIPGCCKKHNKDNAVKYNDEPIYLEFEDVEEQEPILASVVEPSEIKEIYIDGEEYLFKDYVEPSNEMVIAKDVLGTEYYMDDKTFNYSFDNLNEIRNGNLSSIGNYLQSGIEISDQGKYIYYENKFLDKDLIDKAYIKYFSMLGNEIIKNAYVDDNLAKIYDYSRLSAINVVDMIRDDYPLHVFINGQENYIHFSELSKEAKETVLNIVWTNNIALNQKVIYSDNCELNQDDISNIILEKYDQMNMVK